MRPHGLRGELRVHAFAPGAPNLQRGRSVTIEGVRRRIARAREDRGAWILKLDGLDDRTTAERLRGALLETPDAEVRREPGAYFIHELIGLRVVTDQGEEVGRITEVLQNGPTDVYVARGPRGEVLFPAIAEVVRRVDLPVGVMVITPLPGLLDETQ